jgi:hypothetical protein
MTPKDKAIDLIKKFDVKYYYKVTKGQFPVSMHNSVIKQCVLNAIDVVLTTDLYSQDRDYWIEVKDIVTTDFDTLYQAE